MLYQKVRPTSLDDVFGNEQAVAALRLVIEADEKAHCFLFTGPSGCGKTTLARILAKELGCEPMNLVEINAGSHRGIDMARVLEKQAVAPPFGGGARVIILDEAHALTRDAQNAMLKVLEDIPPFLTYCLCSTEPKRLLNTIRTRCQLVEVKPLDDDAMVDLLAHLIDKKKAVPSPGEAVLEEIIRNADGCPRRALVLLEQQQGLPEDEALDIVRSFESREKGVIDLCREVVRGQWSAVVRTYQRIADKDSENIRLAVLGYLKSCLLGAKSPSKAEVFVNAIEELTEPTYSSHEAGLVAGLFRANRACQGKGET